MTNPTELVAPSVEMVEKVARALYCAGEGVDAATNEAHIACYFAPFGPYANVETKAMFDEYRVMARAALAVILPEGWVAVPRDVLTQCRDVAMRQMVEARIPECGKFGELAQELDAMLAAAPISAATSGKEGGR